MLSIHMVMDPPDIRKFIQERVEEHNFYLLPKQSPELAKFRKHKTPPWVLELSSTMRNRPWEIKHLANPRDHNLDDIVNFAIDKLNKSLFEKDKVKAFGVKKVYYQFADRGKAMGFKIILKAETRSGVVGLYQVKACSTFEGRKFLRSISRYVSRGCRSGCPSVKTVILEKLVPSRKTVSCRKGTRKEFQFSGLFGPRLISSSASGSGGWSSGNFGIKGCSRKIGKIGATLAQ